MNRWAILFRPAGLGSVGIAPREWAAGAAGRKKGETLKCGSLDKNLSAKGKADGRDVPGRVGTYGNYVEPGPNSRREGCPSISDPSMPMRRTGAWSLCESFPKIHQPDDFLPVLLSMFVFVCARWRS